MATNLQAYQDYLVKEKNYSPLTVRAYLDDINSFQEYLKEQSINLEEVVYPNIRSWIVVLMEHNMSTTSVNRKISALKSFYKFLLKVKQISVNPLLKHKSLKTAKKVQIPFSEKEINDVFLDNDCMNDFEGIRNRLILELFYTTGIRRAELINLKLSSINEIQKSIRVVGKRNKERVIPMLDCTLNLYRIYKTQRNNLEQINDKEMLIQISYQEKSTKSEVKMTKPPDWGF